MYALIEYVGTDAELKAAAEDPTTVIIMVQNDIILKGEIAINHSLFFYVSGGAGYALNAAAATGGVFSAVGNVYLEGGLIGYNKANCGGGVRAEVLEMSGGSK